MGIVASRASVDIAWAVIVVCPIRVRLVLAWHVLLFGAHDAVIVARANCYIRNTATVVPVGKLTRAEINVCHGIHHVGPAHSVQISVDAATLLVDDTANAHETAVLCVQVSLLERRADRLLVHVAFVDHHGKNQRCRNRMPLRRIEHSIRDSFAECRLPCGGSPAHAIFHFADHGCQASRAGRFERVCLVAFDVCLPARLRVMGRDRKRKRHQTCECSDGMSNRSLTD